MKIAYKHIIENIKERPDIDDLSNKLFQLGHEHEITENGIFEMEFTPNRGDCLSLNGLLRDLNLFYDVKFIKDIYKDHINTLNLNFINNAINDCPNISFLKIDIEEVPKSYTQQLEKYFIDLDVKKNNFFTDVSNYIAYEIGQPTHCYEASKIEDGIKLDYFEGTRKFKTLLDKTIEICDKNLVFFNDKNDIINLAGVIGDQSTSCSKNTKSVIIECAYFNPEALIGKSVKYSIASEAAHKFERNTDPNCHQYALKRFIKIVEENSKITNLEIATHSFDIPRDKTIDYSLNQINKILGTNISEELCRNILESFGFILNDTSIVIPSHRHDISCMNDIAEEVARAVGYNNIKTKRLNRLIAKEDNRDKDIENQIRNLLVENGFNEVINQPFVSIKNKNSISIDNPLDVSRGYLRTSLKSSLLDNLIYNERRQKDSIKLFEISDIYSSELDASKKFLGIIVSGRVDKNYKDFIKKLDKKYLSRILNNYVDDFDLNVEIIPRQDTESKSKNTITYLEIPVSDISTLNESKNIVKKNSMDYKYEPISEYPSSSRDISFAINDFSKLEILKNLILSFENDLIKEVFIFDYFFNSKNQVIKIGFRLVFQSKKSTITEKQVNTIMDDIIDKTNKIDGINIPGIN